MHGCSVDYFAFHPERTVSCVRGIGFAVTEALFSPVSDSRPGLMDALCEANGTFTLRLLKALCEEDPSDNVFFSPVSLSAVLAMVLLGAKGDTAAQVAQVSRERGLFTVSCPLTRLQTPFSRPACGRVGWTPVQMCAASGATGAAQMQSTELRSPFPRCFFCDYSPVNILDVTIKLLS